MTPSVTLGDQLEVRTGPSIGRGGRVPASSDAVADHDPGMGAP